MPERGGPSDKIGNRYEDLWMSLSMTEVMDEHARAIHIQPTESKVKGIDFIIIRNGIREYCQVKSYCTDLGKWTISKLAGGKRKSNVLKNFKTILCENENARCLFLSAHAAYELQELSYRATKASTLADFLTNLSSALAKKLDLLRKEWQQCSEDEAFKLLKRIEVRTVDELSLQRWMLKSLDYLVIGDAAGVGAVLLSLAQKSVDRELRAIDIWHHLEQDGIQRRRIRNDTHALAELEKANKNYVLTFEDNNINGEIIPRKEANTILKRFESDANSGATTHVLLTGESGWGKSGILIQVLDSLVKQGVPVLALRLDWYQSAKSPEQLGEMLGLSGSPLDVLAEIAHGGRSVLILDQFDAVGLIKESPELLYCISELISELKNHPNLQLLIACKSFSLSDDRSVKRLIHQLAIKEAITVSRLSVNSVNQVISKFKPDITLTNAVSQLLSIPLHLKLFIEIEDELDGRYAANTSSLFESLWKYKKKILLYNYDCPEEMFVKIMTMFADCFTDQQTLLVPEKKFDKCEHCVTAIASEGLLIRVGKHFSLFHESFFNFVLARHFYENNRNLIAYVQEEGYYLSHRPQIRSLLLFDRDMHRERYFSNIDFLLSNSEMPFHIKQLIFDMLASFDDPITEECEIIVDIINDSTNSCRDSAWNVLAKSIFWFNKIDSLGWIEKWANMEQLADRVLALIPKVAQDRPHRAAELLHSFVSSEMGVRLAQFIPQIDFSLDLDLLNLLLQLIKNGKLDNGLNSQGYDYLSHLITPLSDKHPDWACRVIGHYLDRSLDLSLKSGQRNPFDNNKNILPAFHQDLLLLKCATNAPLQFFQNIFPFMSYVMHLTTDERKSERKGALLRDHVWRFRHYDGGYKSSDTLLTAMERAFHELALKHPDSFKNLASELQQSDFETVHYLLVRGYRANGQVLADHAARYLCTRQEYYGTGYVGNQYWASKELLEAISPYCSQRNMSLIEGQILNYHDAEEKNTRDSRSTRRAQFILLSGVQPSRLSSPASKRLKTLRQEFGNESLEPPKAKGGYAQPPIPEEVAAKLTDHEWLDAVQLHDRDAHFFSGDNLVGGSYELSSLLELETGKNPERFARLALTLSDDINHHYYEAILRGVAKSDLDAATRIELCKHCHKIAGKPYGRGICDVFSNFGKEPLTKEALAILRWYAVEDPDPSQEWWREEATAGEHSYAGDIFTAGLNSVRGLAALAIADIIGNDENRLPSARCQQYLAQTIAEICNDQCIAVRSCAFEIIRQLSTFDPTRALRDFFALVKTDDVLLGTPPATRFLNDLLESHFEELEPVFLRMIHSELENVVTLGAQFLCLIALFLKQPYPVAEICLSSNNPAQRAGVADMCAKYLFDSGRSSFCEEALCQLFKDSDRSVRYKAATCFTHLKDEKLASVNKLVETFVRSRAFEENYRLLLHALVRSTAKLPGITIEACSRFLEIEGKNSLDFTKEAFAVAQSAVTLAFRGYQENVDDIKMRDSYQNLINRMLEMGVYGIERELSRFDDGNPKASV